jgi:hypothetical protein
MGRHAHWRRPRRAVGWLLALTAALQSVPAQGSGTDARAVEEPTELRRVRGKRWWLDFWSHSMQEQAFVEWMNHSTGGIAWMQVMPAAQVEAIYAWWLAEIWFGTGDAPPR